METIKIEHCDMCFYWVGKGGGRDCRVKSPFLVYTEDSDAFWARYPITIACDGCGQWRDKNPPYRTLQRKLDAYMRHNPE